MRREVNGKRKTLQTMKVVSEIPVILIVSYVFLWNKNSYDSANKPHIFLAAKKYHIQEKLDMCMIKFHIAHLY